MGHPLFALLLLLAAPAVPEAESGFSHKSHLDRGLVCSSCHDANAAPGAPVLKPQTCLKCHQSGPPDFAPLPKPRALEAAFPHRVHASKLECAACHAGVAEDKLAAGKPVLAVETCLQCHTNQQVPVSETSCVRCHAVDLKRVRPPDHGPNWTQTHGAEAAWRVDDQMHGQDCRQCHSKSACKECHDQVEPKNHTGLWRMQAHGIAAEWDRDTCKTCHEVATCVRCHQSTQPINHAGPWIQEHGLVAGSRVSESCSVCHQPAFCAACHNRASRK